MSLDNLVAFFRRLFNLAPRAATVLDRIHETVQLALPVVRGIAGVTRNKTDDQIISIIQMAGLPLLGLASDWLRHDDLVRHALRSSAVLMLKKQGVLEPDRVLNAAVELAYTMVREESSGEPNNEN